MSYCTYVEANEMMNNASSFLLRNVDNFQDGIRLEGRGILGSRPRTELS